MTTLHPPSTCPEWHEDFNLPLRASPTTVVLRIFDRDFSTDSEVCLGSREIVESYRRYPPCSSTSLSW